MTNFATDTAAEIDEIGADLVGEVDDAVGALRSAVDSAVDYLKAHPAHAVIGAAALGFVLAQLLRRR